MTYLISAICKENGDVGVEPTHISVNPSEKNNQKKGSESWIHCKKRIPFFYINAWHLYNSYIISDIATFNPVAGF